MATALVPLAQGFDELEAVTIINVLRRAGVEVVTASLDRGVIKGSKAVTLVSDTFLDDAIKGSYDLVALPGGKDGTAKLQLDRRILELCKRQLAAGKLLAASGTSTLVLAGAGLLDGKRATAQPGVLTAAKYPKISLVDALVVEDGPLVTSKSAGTALDLAYILALRLMGELKQAEVKAKLNLS